MPAYGNAFITQGYIYPAGTLDGRVERTLANGDPAFPDLVIGEWTCDGYFVADGMRTETGAIVITRQGGLWRRDMATLPISPCPERHSSRAERRDPQAHRRRAARDLECGLPRQGRNRIGRIGRGLSRYSTDTRRVAGGKYPEGLAVFTLPKHHHRRMSTSNPMERSVQQELKRRTVKVRVFPNEAALERLVSAVLVEIDDKWAADTNAYIKWECQDA